MAFVVEDGTGKADATSYVSIADADAYFTDRGTPAAWTAADTTEKEQALVKGTQWLDAHYRWNGDIASTTQALGWPRLYAEDRWERTIDDDVVPQAVKDACCEAAVRSMAADLEADETQKVSEEEVVGAVRVKYEDGAPAGTRYPLIDQILRGLATSSDYQLEVVRG